MKIKKESVILDPGQSFHLFQSNITNYFYWHYHPEYELVYVEAAHGIRHVGQHISNFQENDLILIGPNIPHLHFGYGVETDYYQIGVQFKQSLLTDAFQQMPEFGSIKNLFEKADRGLSFKGEIKLKIADRLREIQGLSPFDKLLKLFQVLQTLANSNDFEALNEKDTSIKLMLDDKIRMGSVYQYVHKNFNKNPDVNKVAKEVHLSTAAFCRYMKKQTKMTFTEFVNTFRINYAKTLLLKDLRVSEVCYEVGFDSLSHFTRLFSKMEGESPSSFKKRFIHRYL